MSDDWIFVTEPLIRRLDGIVSIWLSPSEIPREDHYWPVVYTSFWIEHKLWGFKPVGYHAVNVALHALNSVLVWRLLLRLSVPGAGLVVAVFAVHPVHVQSVAWIIERKDLLSTLFYLGAVHAWLRFTQAPGAGRYSRSLSRSPCPPPSCCFSGGARAVSHCATSDASRPCSPSPSASPSPISPSTLPKWTTPSITRWWSAPSSRPAPCGSMLGSSCGRRTCLFSIPAGKCT